MRDDVSGGGDLPPETPSGDVLACQRLWEKEEPECWLWEEEKSGVQLEELSRRVLSGYQEHGPADDAHEKSTEGSSSEGSSES